MIIETIMWVAGFYLLATIGVWIAERIENYQVRDILPPPDRSTERGIQTADRLSRNTFRNARQG